VGQILVVLLLGSVVYAIIESKGPGWTSPFILCLVAVAVLSAAGIGVYESSRADPLLELRLFRSVPFSAAIVMALLALYGFGAFLFVTTQYLQDVRGLPAPTAGLRLLPVGDLVVVLSPRAGRLVAVRSPAAAGSPRCRAGAGRRRLALARTGHPAARRARGLPAVRHLPGCRQPADHQHGGIRMPRSMAGVAASLASAGRQTGTTLGVAISGTIAGSALARGGMAFTSAEHAVPWTVLGLGTALRSWRC
jgi:hypothetical protein